jgi:L-ascorbate metabolism protein UlaG (beta-lactamase superfamily)
VVFAPEDCVEKIKGEVKTLGVGEEAKVDSIKIKAVGAYNVKRFRSPGNPFHPKGFGVGYLITASRKTVYHGGDTDFIPEMKQLGHVDVALLPSGGTYTMDNAEAADAALAINSPVVIPMHRWDTKPDEFKKKVEASSSIRVVLLKRNEEYQVV